MNKVLQTLEGVTGWLSDNEAIWLNHHAAQVTEGCIVEIGSYQGKSTIALALNAQVNVYAIDPHEAHTDEVGGTFGPADRARFHENIVKAGVHERVCPVNLCSRAAYTKWSRASGFVFIDGAHNYVDVCFDAFNWGASLLNGGILAIHDRTWPDIARVLDELDSDPCFQRYAICDSIQAYRKVL